MVCRQENRRLAWALKGSAGNIGGLALGNGHQEIFGVAWVQLGGIRKFRLVGIQVDGNDGWSPIQVSNGSLLDLVMAK